MGSTIARVKDNSKCVRAVPSKHMVTKRWSSKDRQFHYGEMVLGIEVEFGQAYVTIKAMRKKIKFRVKVEKLFDILMFRSDQQGRD